MNNSPYHKIVKCLVENFRLIGNQVSRRNLKRIVLYVVKSFTVVSLAEKIRYICDYSEVNNLDIGVRKLYLEELSLRFTLNEHFRFNNAFYRQTNNIAMGLFLDPKIRSAKTVKEELVQLSEIFIDRNLKTRLQLAVSLQLTSHELDHKNRRRKRLNRHAEYRLR
ncbi:hypothetical protein MN116_005197 [Schistosoma mekongi]|uniref:Uncharacterized protein n=1 Tax=Schistosoma mekongi TaxID=38744 RepID=A0AAE1ZCL4_SCHME|nr:hypothetical protein MN116_005197 [Schistosoma mekongi]